MSDLPEGWIYAHADDIKANRPNALAIGPFGSNLKVSDYRDEGVPLVFVRNIRAKAFSPRDLKYVSEAKAAALRSHRVEQGDVLVTKMGDPPGDTAIYPLAEQGIVTADCIKLTPHSAVDARYVMYALMSPAVKRQILRITQGVAQPKMSLDRFRSGVQIPVAPTAEQARIVAAIEEQFSRVDAGVAALDQVRQNLKRMRAASLQAAVTGRLAAQRESEGSGQELLHQMLTERSQKKVPAAAGRHDMVLPNSWAVASLEALTDPDRPICYGILMPRVKEAGVVPYVEVKDLRAKRLSVASLHRTSQELHEAFPRSILAAGDVVLAIRGSFDRALVVPDEVAGANVSRDVARLAPLDGLDPDFLAAYLTSPPSLQYLRQRARGVAVKGVNIADLRNMPIPVPPIAEQRRITKELQRHLSIMDDILNSVEQAHVRSDHLRSSTLAAAFSGELVAQDPNDESASFLLERVAAARAASNSQAKTPVRKSRTVSTRVT